MLRSRLRHAKEDDDRAIQPRDVLIAEPADVLAEAGPGNRCELVDHQLGWTVQPVELGLPGHPVDERLIVDRVLAGRDRR